MSVSFNQSMNSSQVNKLAINDNIDGWKIAKTAVIVVVALAAIAFAASGLALMVLNPVAPAFGLVMLTVGVIMMTGVVAMASLMNKPR